MDIPVEPLHLSHPPASLNQYDLLYQKILHGILEVARQAVETDSFCCDFLYSWEKIYMQFEAASFVDTVYYRTKAACVLKYRRSVKY
jgi:hypothetical protein